ncbi:MAG: DUF5667 domain-containing protein [Candidatus Woesebacteria bacterium]|jgi:hypothetical protein
MIKRLAIIVPVLVFAFGVLFTSIFRTAAIKYKFAEELAAATNDRVLGEHTTNIPYNLAYPGKVLPDHPLWPLKAFRDRVWLIVTTNPSRKAELKLLFADKRLASAEILFDREKYEIGYSTLTKAEKYLEESAAQESENRKNGIDTSEFLRTLSYASLKHTEVINSILSKAPEDARPQILNSQNYSKGVYEKTMHALQEKGMNVPENPFDGQ